MQGKYDVAVTGDKKFRTVSYDTTAITNHTYSFDKFFVREKNRRIVERKKEKLLQLKLSCIECK